MVHFLPKLGVKCARRTLCRKLSIRISTYFPSFAWILSACCSSQPRDLCHLCLVPSKICCSPVYSIGMPQVTILFHSSCLRETKLMPQHRLYMRWRITLGAVSGSPVPEEALPGSWYEETKLPPSGCERPPICWWGSCPDAQEIGLWEQL